MKLIRFGLEGEEKPGVILGDGRRIDVSGFGADYDESFFGGQGMELLREWLEHEAAGAPEVPTGVRLGPPTCRPSKIICIGLNYADHAAETGVELPTEPIIFFKAPSSWCGPNDDLIIPRGSEKTDWEVELAVVIGKRALYVEEAEALEHIAGYGLMNDYSERAFQMEHCGQWVKGKSADRFAPFGPFMATPDELPDVDDLKMWLSVNGESRQDSSTAQMVFRVPFLVSYLSRFMSLVPGDIISTGTPPGVGLGQDPPEFLKPGDVVELGIDGLGVSRQVAVAAD
ncbi:MAG: fumarylacetoacetate hydrolase family protein [Verrucomicrobiota bacterium]